MFFFFLTLERVKGSREKTYKSRAVSSKKNRGKLIDL